MFFDRYQPDAHGSPLPGLTVREVADADFHVCARLAALQAGGSTQWWADRLRASLSSERVMFVATVEDRIAGYARIRWRTPSAEGGHRVPDGWYLSGILVDATLRRRGVGRALTQARLDWVWQRADHAYMVASHKDLTSIDLHRELGFREITRDFYLPGVVFIDGGVLLECTPTSLSEQVTPIGLAVS